MSASAEEVLRQLAALNRISRIALQDMALRPMLQRIVDALNAEFGWEFIAFAGIDPVRGEFVCDAVHASIDSEVQVGYRRALGSGVVGHVAVSGETVDIPDTRGHPLVIDTLGGTRSELCVPIIHDGRVLAALNVESLRLDAFRGQRDLLETVAAQISGALHAADLLQRLETANAQLRDAYRVMEQQAQRDGLTGIANRRRFDAALTEAWSAAQVPGQCTALLLIDIDHFKAYNDGYGHLAGDQCLREVAAALTESVAGTEATLARYGGEEFAVVLAGATTAEAMMLAERLRMSVEARALPHAHSAPGRVTLSIGVAMRDATADSAPATLVGRADSALYAAKRGGRNRVVVAEHGP